MVGVVGITGVVGAVGAVGTVGVVELSDGLAAISSSGLGPAGISMPGMLFSSSSEIAPDGVLLFIDAHLCKIIFLRLF